MLFICAVLLGAFIWFIERDSATSAQNRLLHSKVFEAYPEEISWIRMERGETAIECVRTGDTWRMTHPVDASVNSAIVDRMIGGMANVERGELITEETMSDRGITPAEYGFDDPRATITFRNNHGTFTWEIGRDAPLGESLYVMAADSKDIIATAKTLLHLVPNDPSIIRERTLFKHSAAAVHGIDLRRTGGIIQLRQDGKQHWVLQQPVTGDAELSQVSQLIDHTFTASILDFIDEEPSDLTVYGLEEPAIELTLLDQDEHPQTLQIGKILSETPKQQYAKWADSPAVFTVPSDWVTEFELDSKRLRSRRLLADPPERISAISITSETQQVDLLRTNNEWQVIRPAHWNAEPKSIDTLLDHLANSMILEFIDTPDAATAEQAANPRWTIALTAGDRTRTLRMSPSGNTLLLQRDNETSFSQTNPEAFDEHFADPLFYRNRTLLQVDPQQIKSIDLQTPGGTFRVEKNGDSFTSPNRDQSPDSSALTQLTAELIHLRSGRYAAFNPNSLAPFGLDAPQEQLTITLTGTNTIGQVILFGHSVPGGRYAMLRGQPLVFILPEKTATTLTRELTQSVENKPTETQEP